MLEASQTTSTSTPAASTAPTGWFVVTTNGVQTASVGENTATAEIRLRSHGLNAGIAEAAKVLGRADVQQKVRLALNAGEPAAARWLLLQAEASRLSLEARRVEAKLATAQATRAEILLEARPGFAHEIARLDGLVADLQAPLTAATSASAAIVSATAEARDEALRVFVAVDDAVHLQAFSALRRRREALVAALPALVAATLTELAVVDRASMLARAPSLKATLEHLLDELAAAPPAVSSEPAPSPDAPAVAPDALPEVTGASAEAAPESAAPEAPAQCEARRKDGQQCNGRSLACTTRCVLHNTGKRAAAAPADGAAVGGG